MHIYTLWYMMQTCKNMGNHIDIASYHHCLSNEQGIDRIRQLAPWTHSTTKYKHYFLSPFLNSLPPHSEPKNWIGQRTQDLSALDGLLSQILSDPLQDHHDFQKKRLWHKSHHWIPSHLRFPALSSVPHWLTLHLVAYSLSTMLMICSLW